MPRKKKEATPAAPRQSQVMVTATETHKAVHILSSRGHRIDIELWEHCPGELLLHGVSGSLTVKQISHNLVRVFVTR